MVTRASTSGVTTCSRAARYNTIKYWTDLAKTLSAACLTPCSSLTWVGIYGVYKNSAAQLSGNTQVP